MMIRCKKQNSFLKSNVDGVKNIGKKRDKKQ